MDFDKPKVYGDTFISDGLVTLARDLCETAELCLSYNCEDEEDRARLCKL